MLLRLRIPVAAVTLLFPIVLGAQSADTSVTRLLLAGGPISGPSAGWTPAYSVGIERKPLTSSVTFRLSLAVWEGEAGQESQFPQWSRGVGAELVGIHRFGERRVQPYFFAGAGVYHRRTEGYSANIMITDSGFVNGPTFHYLTREVRPAILWGTGVNLRIGATTLFVEARFPVYYGSAFHYAPQLPLLLGIRF
jgi:hypothetical protein